VAKANLYPQVGSDRICLDGNIIGIEKKGH